MEGVLEGLSEKGSLEGPSKRERNTYLGRAIIRGSLCLLLDWTPPPPNWLPEFFFDFSLIDKAQSRVPYWELLG